MRDLSVAKPELLQRRRLLKVSTSRTVEVPPDAVWSVIADHSTWSTWHADYDKHAALTKDTTGLGARFSTKEWVLNSESEITRWEPGRVIGLSLLRADGWSWLLNSYYTELAVEPVSDGTGSAVVHYRVAFTGSILFWLLCAYSVGYSLAGIYVDARSSLKKLEQMVTTTE